jgi:hypothetical protein
VYRAAPPGAAGAGDGPLRVARAGRQAFGPGSSAAALDPHLRVYLSDMAAPYGLALREDLLAEGAGQSYGDMAGSLLARLVPADQPVDLLILAFAVHDVVPGRSAAAYLSSLCPGAPMAFAVCDQGAAAPFTGLQLIREYTRTAQCRRAVLAVVEQDTLPYEVADPAVLPTRSAAVLLLCDQDGTGGLQEVRQYPGTSPAQAGALLARELTALAGGRDDVTLIAGSALAPPAGSAGAAPLRAALPAGSEVVFGPAGQPVTGVWWELAGGLPGWATRGRRVLLAEYEAALRYLCVSVIDISPEPAAAAPRPAAQHVP